MNTFKTVYSFDDEGVYVGNASAQLDKNGKVMMPAGTTNTKPPEAKEGFNIVFDGSKWRFVKEPENEPEEENNTFLPTWEDKRRAEYPTAEEFMDAYFDGGLDSLKEKRMKIKKKYPKESV